MPDSLLPFHSLIQTAHWEYGGLDDILDTESFWRRLPESSAWRPFAAELSAEGCRAKPPERGPKWRCWWDVDRLFCNAQL